jgi:hypothetical protein
MRSISSLALVFVVVACKSSEPEPCPSYPCNDFVEFYGATSIPLAVLDGARITICHDATCVRAESAGFADAGADTARGFVIPAPLGGNFVLTPTDKGVNVNGRAQVPPRTVHAGDTWSFRVEVDGAATPLIDLTLHPKYTPVFLYDIGCNTACQSADLGDLFGCGSRDADCVPGVIERDASCAPGNAKTRVCTEACAWSEWSACGAWRPMATPPKEFRPRGVPGTTWARDRFVVLGGSDGPTPLLDGALYDPVADAWTMLPAAPFGRLGRSLATAEDGTIFLVSDQGPVQLSLATDPPTWSKLPTPTVLFPTSTPEPMGSGFLPASREVMFFACPFVTGAHEAIAYSLDKGTWRELPSLGKARDMCDAYPVQGSVAFTGVKGALSIFDGAIDGWRSSSLPADTLGLTRGAPLFGVAFGERVAAQAFVFDLPSLVWSPVPPPPFELGGQSVAASAIGTNAGRLIVWGTNHRPVGAVFDPVASRWSRLPDGGPTARTHMQTLWTGKETIVWGGDLLLTSLVDGKRLVLE